MSAIHSSRQIENLLDIFDFFSVQTAMQAMGWQYAHGLKQESQFDEESIMGNFILEVPSTEKLREIAGELLQFALETQQEVSSGGFRAECFPGGNLRLTFCLSELEVDSDGGPV